MTIAFVSVLLNIHQIGIADELYKLSSGNFWFIETGIANEETKKGGEDFSSRPYLIRPFRSKNDREKTISIIRDVDVLIYGAAPLVFFKERVKTGKLTFQYGERWFKRGIINIISPRLIKQQFFYHTHCYNKPIYALCSSAYGADDYKKLFSYKNKCYKWGYFTAVKNLNINLIIEKKRNVSTLKILWVARFLKWKHPERMLQLAFMLKNHNTNFVINMIGTGETLDKSKKIADELGVSEYVKFLGSMSNEDVLHQMQNHHIFCLTSDKNEGWGAVLNEAMSNGCCPVASIECGASPYLIKNGVNGLLFNPKKKHDFYNKIIFLIDNKEKREKMSISAYHTMHDMWSPKVATERLFKLSESLIGGEPIVYKEGPCSKA